MVLQPNTLPLLASSLFVNMQQTTEEEDGWVDPFHCKNEVNSVGGAVGTGVAAASRTKEVKARCAAL